MNAFNENEDILLKPKEAAKFLLLDNEKTLANWRSTKRYPLPYLKVGGRVLYRRSDLQAFLELRTVR